MTWRIADSQVSFIKDKWAPGVRFRDDPGFSLCLYASPLVRCMRKIEKLSDTCSYKTVMTDLVTGSRSWGRKNNRKL
jgi:hypothetical protein